MLSFYECQHCGNMVMFLKSSGVVPVCCGDQMLLMKPGISDGALEKHVPVINVNGNRVIVTVGEQAHPMTSEHHIDWILLETNKGVHITYLSLMDGKADAGFTLEKGEHVIAAYEHCNLHGLWMCEA